VQGVNWLVGLSGAAIGGALVRFDWLQKLPNSAKGSFLLAACFFFASILCGVYYVFQLFAVRRYKEDLDRVESQWPPDETQAQEATNELERVQTRARTSQHLTILMFFLAAVTSVVALGFALFWARPVAETPVQNQYLITTSKPHLTGRFMHSHTFLLNQQTGEIWEMTCRKDGTVEFRRVRKISYDGSPEEPPAARVH